MTTWELVEYEHFYKPEYYERGWIDHVKLVGLLAAVMVDFRERRREWMYFDPDGNAGRLCLEIISCFAAESEKGGAEFIIVHLPGGKILSDYARTGVFIHARFLDCLDGCYNVVHPEKALADVVRKHSWETLIQHGHYSAPGDRIVGEAVADFIIKSRTD